MPARGGHRFGPDRQTFDIERMRAVSFQRAPVDNHPRGPAFRADGEWRYDDIGEPAILFQRPANRLRQAPRGAASARFSFPHSASSRFGMKMLRTGSDGPCPALTPHHPLCYITPASVPSPRNETLRPAP